MENAENLKQILGIAPMLGVAAIAGIFAFTTVLIARWKKDKRSLVWFGAGFILGPLGWILALILAKPQSK